MVEKPAPGRKQLPQSLEVLLHPLHADVLEHPNAGYGVKRPVIDVAVIGQTDLDPVGQARLGHALGRQRVLGL